MCQERSVPCQEAGTQGSLSCVRIEFVSMVCVTGGKQVDCLTVCGSVCGAVCGGKRGGKERGGGQEVACKWALSDIYCVCVFMCAGGGEQVHCV